MILCDLVYILKKVLKKVIKKGITPVDRIHGVNPSFIKQVSLILIIIRLWLINNLNSPVKGLNDAPMAILVIR